MKRIAFISCGSKKLRIVDDTTDSGFRALPACKLYTGTIFTLQYRYAQKHADEIYIVSALHGIIHENKLIEPYEKTLPNTNTKNNISIENFHKLVVRQLKENFDLRNTYFILLLPQRYRRDLEKIIPECAIPFKNMGMFTLVKNLYREINDGYVP